MHALNEEIIEFKNKKKKHEHGQLVERIAGCTREHKEKFICEREKNDEGECGIKKNITL